MRLRNIQKSVIVLAVATYTMMTGTLIVANELDEEPPIRENGEYYERLTKQDFSIIKPIVEVDISEYEVKEEVIEEVVIEELLNWQRPCAISSVKSYMDYRAITMVNSAQYQYIRNNMTSYNGLLYEDNYIGVALGSWWGNIGAKWTIELDTGISIDVVKVDEKSDKHTRNGCEHISDGSVIEIVIDRATVPSNWWGSNGLVFNGNFNNSEMFKGNIKSVARH